MNTEAQAESVKAIIRNWTRNSDCNSVDALVAIIEVLEFDPYEREESEIVAREAGAGE